MDNQAIEIQFNTVCRILKDELNPQGFWSGYLSSSALSTAVSIVNLKLADETKYQQRITQGLNWLLENINIDGGFGDTPESESNVSTSLLSYAAIHFCSSDTEPEKAVLISIEKYLNSHKISFELGNVAKSVLDFYGKDLTFSVPILSMLVICGVLKTESLKKIPQLPFEFSLLPNSLYQFFNLQVVSYAIPALIGVGIYLFKTKKSRNPVSKIIRNKSILPALRKLEQIMPESGGFLEAIPLTAFTSMCLIKSGFMENPVVQKGCLFVENQQRNDGSWPIDTDLSTWVSTLAIKALGPAITKVLGPEHIVPLKKHLLNLQYKSKHPFNQADAGGWGWTGFSGSVPDADDTPGAIIALLGMYEGTMDEVVAILQGCQWLLGIQNSDGGIPTFCKGWGRLPFDQSCADLTGHSLLAWIKSLQVLGEKVPKGVEKQINKGVERAVEFLNKKQNKDGLWLPLWFGSQLEKNKHNPVYGTARVGVYIQDCLLLINEFRPENEVLREMLLKAAAYIQNQQNPDGSWGATQGADGTVEETSLAISLLAKTHKEACIEGLKWIENKITENGFKSSPIGLYFASLWYDEKLYPIIFYLDALRRILETEN